MKTIVAVMAWRRRFHSLARPLAFTVFALPGIACAQEASSAMRVYTLADFLRFAPTSAMDMLNQVPGFAVRNDDDQGRGLGQVTTNVLINGERPSSKSQSVFDQLNRITSENVERIEIVDGATLKIPGLSGQVANVITKTGAISGRYQYRTIHRPKYARPMWGAGEISVNGSSPGLEWNAAFNHGAGRGAAGGSANLMDGTGTVTEWRDMRQQFIGEFPKLSGNVKWRSAGGTVANVNASVNGDYTDNSLDEARDLVAVDAVDYYRDFDNRNRGDGHELGGDLDFALGPGRLKLIGLDRLNSREVTQNVLQIFSDGSPTTGTRFSSESESSERIGRSEYSWDAWGGNWQLAAEAAFNKLEQGSQLFNLASDGGYEEVALPLSSGEVTEDRYEMVLTHSRTFANGVSMQLGAGGETSELAQSGPGGLTRDFFRPKGSLSLAWKPYDGLDLSLKIARSVGQLSFGDFLASMSLQQGNRNAGNVELKPTQSWTTDIGIKRDLGAWGSTTLTLFGRLHDDYIDVIPLPGGGESSGNIDTARLYGVTWNNTINFDPMRWRGGNGLRLTANVTIEDSEVEDPLTGKRRSFSGHFDRRANFTLRRDIPASNWAWGVGLEYVHAQPAFRIAQISKDYEGPAYTFAFIEHKDVFGMIVNLNVFNVTDGRWIFHRTVYTDRRDNSPVLFIENRNLSVQPIFRLQITGTF
ncbi:MAG: TonB-dependent receptor plug domain-containing protein [Pseudomonadota bacterium]|nr:TonB-dependent receptor plug domain-containing protein [Pseudomonadota bacterium]